MLAVWVRPPRVTHVLGTSNSRVLDYEVLPALATRTRAEQGAAPCTPIHVMVFCLAPTTHRGENQHLKAKLEENVQWI